MEYRNKKTGFVFFSDCKVSGENWELVDNDSKAEVEKAEEEVVGEDEESVVDEEIVEEAEGLSNIKVDEIKQELDAMGIEYNPRAKKQELYDLMMSQGK